jgi:hypothetical protein
MNRKVMVISLFVVLALFIGLVLYSHFSLAIEVSNVKLTYGPQISLGTAVGYIPVIDFTVKNIYSSNLSAVDLAVDGTDYGYSALELLPGQTQNVSLSLKNMNLTSSETYSVKLTFKFADGKYQSYSQSYATPQFQGQAQVVSSSLTLGHLLVEFSLTMKNTGNLPIANINCTIANRYQALFLIKGGAVLPGDAITGGWSGAYSSVGAVFQAGTAYSVAIQLTYAGGSTSAIQTSVIAQS